MTTDYSIECALPYIDDLDGAKETFQLALSGLVKQLGEGKKTYTRVLLVDDVTNDGGEGYDLDGYTAASNGTNEADDITVFRESMLNELGNEIYAQLTSSTNPQEVQGLKTDKGYSDSFYIAIWSLLRLGYLSHPDFPPEKVSTRITNILPEVFRPVEEESMAIISRTQFAEAAQKVDYIFI